MIYLLDVNALLAYHYRSHVHHYHVTTWVAGRQRELGSKHLALATCAITELGFVRIAGGVARLARNVQAACADLTALKASAGFQFLSDSVAIDSLPSWVNKPDQTTDGHLLMLAQDHKAQLATLDTGIPGAELISDYPESPWRVREPSSRFGRAA